VSAKLELDVAYSARRPWVPEPRQFRRWAGAALAGRTQSFVLSIRVVGAARSRRLNARYRAKDRATNVLSFAGAGLGPDGRSYVGELVICAPVVAAEAFAQGKTREQHWAHMTVHGVLHLLGLDHGRAAQARTMEAIEVQILDQVGFSTAYL